MTEDETVVKTYRDASSKYTLQVKVSVLTSGLQIEN